MSGRKPLDLTKLPTIGKLSAPNEDIPTRYEVDKLLGQTIVIFGYDVRQSDHNNSEYLAVEAILYSKNQLVEFTTSQRHIVDRISRVPQDGFPFACVIIKEGKSHKLVDPK